MATRVTAPRAIIAIGSDDPPAGFAACEASFGSGGSAIPPTATDAVTLASVQVAGVMTTGLQLPVSTPGFLI
jgi:hypothetical protein